jgi:arylsulfatase A-like enzyme
MNTTHFPYNAPEEHKRFPGTALIDRYENALAYLDLRHGEILDTLERRDLLKNTVIVFASDHGEAFGEHGAYGHQRLFHEEGIHVPFWLYLPRALADRHRNALEASRLAVHSNLDIVPTIIGLLGIGDDPQVADIRRELMGQSLISPEAAAGQPVVVYNGYTALSLQRGFALADGPFRVLMHPERGQNGAYRFEAYNLDEDPLQTRNLWKRTAAPLRQRWISALEPYPELHQDLTAVFRHQSALTAAHPAVAR